MVSNAADFNLRQNAAWRSQLERARNEAEVLQLCLNFLSHWNAHRRAALPDSCQPPLKMYSASQVAEYAVRLVQADLLEDSQTPELHAMASYFASASARLSQLLKSDSSRARVPFFTTDAR